MNQKFRIEPGLCILGAVALLLLPLRWLLAAVLAAAVHELGHIGMLRFLGVEIGGIRIGLRGAVLETEPMDRKTEFLSALAGPAAGMLLIPFARILPCTVLCALVQSVYNLIPVGQLDGGRVLRCTLSAWIGEKGNQLYTGVSRVISAGILAFSLGLAMLYRIGGVLVLAAVGLCLQAFTRNTSCKSGFQAVQ